MRTNAGKADWFFSNNLKIVQIFCRKVSNLFDNFRSGRGYGVPKETRRGSPVSFNQWVAWKASQYQRSGA